MKRAIFYTSLALLSIVVQAAPPSPCQTEVGTSVENFATFVQARSDTNFLLKSGECLVSPNRAFMAVMQTAGNLVVYPVPGQSEKNYKWASSIYPKEGASLLVQQDGHLVIYPKFGVVIDKDGKPQGRQDVQPAWVSGPPVQPFDDYFLAMQNDGNLVLYRGLGPDTSKGSIFDTNSSAAKSNGGGGTSTSKPGCSCSQVCTTDQATGITFCNCKPDTGCGSP